MSGVAVLLHDGYYGCGTGAGRSNRALLSILIRHLPDAVLRIMPVHLAPAGPEYDAAWHTATRALTAGRLVAVHPLDNGTCGRTRFGGLAHFRTACAAAADHLNALPGPDQPRLILALDAVFHGLAPLLAPHLAARMLLVPRSTARLHAPEDHERTGWEHAGFAALAASGGHIAAISAHMRTHLAADYQVPTAVLIDMPNGLTAEEWRRPATAPPVPPPARGGFLLALGRAAPAKGFADLIDAVALLRRQDDAVPHLVLAAVTETAELNQHQRHLAGRIRALNLDATLITRYDPGLPGLFTHSALRGVVVPSRAEPFGRIPLEAFAANAAPVIATTAGGLTETVTDGSTGITAAPGEPTALATAIARGLALNPGELAAMREAGARTARARDYDCSVLAALQAVAPQLLSAQAVAL